MRPNAKGLLRRSTSTDRDRETVRRALRAGTAVWLALSAVLVAVTALLGGTGRQGAVVVTLALVVGTLVTAAWLLLAAGLDLATGAFPSRRRALWTIAATLVAAASPVLVLGAQGG